MIIYSLCIGIYNIKKKQMLKIINQNIQLINLQFVISQIFYFQDQ
jgi:hypothetical protein